MIRLTKGVRRENVKTQYCVNEIVSLAHIYKNPQWKFSLHKHEDCCELIFIAAGHGRCKIADLSYSVNEGDWIAVNQNVGHIQESDSKEPLDSWNVTIRLKGALQKENCLIPYGYKAVMHTGEWKDEVHHLYRRLFQEMQSQNIGWEMCSLLCVDQLVNLWLRIFEKNKLELIDEKHTENVAAFVKSYIDEHYTQKISLDFLAMKAHVSKYYIVHQMKEQYGVTPIEYQIQRRIGEAQNLLCTTNMSVTEISEWVGYSDVYYFSRIFTARLGMSPTKFRSIYKT